MSNNKTLPLAGPVIVVLGIFAGWVTWGLARMGSKNAQPGPFIITAQQLPCREQPIVQMPPRMKP